MLCPQRIALDSKGEKMFFSKKSEVQSIFEKMYKTSSKEIQLKIDTEITIFGYLQTQLYKDLIFPFYQISKFDKDNETDNLIFTYTIKSLNTDILKKIEIFSFGGNLENNAKNYQHDFLLCFLNRNNNNYKNLIDNKDSICETTDSTFDKMINKIYGDIYLLIYEKKDTNKFLSLKKTFIDFTQYFLSGVAKTLNKTNPSDIIIIAKKIRKTFTDASLAPFANKLMITQLGGNINNVSPVFEIDHEFNLEMEFDKLTMNPIDSNIKKENNKNIDIEEDEFSFIEMLKRYVSEISERLKHELSIKEDCICIEIYSFLYIITDFWFVLQEKTVDDRKKIFDEVESLLLSLKDNVSLTEEKIKQVFDDRIKNYSEILAKNDNAIDGKFFSKCIKYQTQLFGNLMTKNEFSFYKAVPSEIYDYSPVLTSFILSTKIENSLKDVLEIVDKFRKESSKQI